MRRIYLIAEYEGTNYTGWQTQPNGLAVQEVMEKALLHITGEQIALHASGRTDSGVHALAQVAHFDTKARMPADKFAYALNALLPRDIRIRHSADAPEGFHARFDVLEKRYRYCILHGPHARAFSRSTTLHLHGSLDLHALEVAAKKVIGSHDFHGFMAAGSSIENTIRTIYASNWTFQKAKGSMLCYYDIAGSGFLYNMVRILVGTMLDIAKGTLPPESMELALQSGRRSDAGATAPAHGLMLMGVKYPCFDTDDFV